MTKGPRHAPHTGANLTPFKKGYDPNRAAGRRSFSRRILAFVNSLTDTDDEGRARYGLDELEKIAADRTDDQARATAASLIVYVRETGWDKIAKNPKMLSTVSWLFDRQLGKAAQHVHLTKEKAPSLQEAEIALADALKSLPADQSARRGDRGATRGDAVGAASGETEARRQ